MVGSGPPGPGFMSCATGCSSPMCLWRSCVELLIGSATCRSYYGGSGFETTRCAHYRRDRAGRRLSGRAVCSAKAMWCTASSAARRPSTPSGSIISTRIRTAGDAPFFLHYGDLTDFDQPDPPRAGDPARRDLQSRRAEPCAGQLRDARNTPPTPTRIGTLRLLEAIRILGLEKKTRFYQASTSELYGKVQEVPQRETTPFYPRSPYGVGQALCLLDHGQLPRGLRHASPPTASCSIMRARSAARPSSPARSRAPSPRIQLGLQDKLYLGNLDAKRDWGHARDYVEGMWLMLQQDEPDDYVLATGETHSVREFVELAFAEVGRAHRLARQGRRRERASTTAIRRRPGRDRSALFPPDRGRPAARRCQQGARRSSAGSTKVTFAELVAEMVAASDRCDAGCARRDGATAMAMHAIAFDCRASASWSPAIAAWSARRWCAGWRGKAPKC